jgi:mannose-6-phosphate isomerase-like protein (cupin superfamily)
MQLDFKKFEIKKIQAPNFLMSPLELKDYIDFEVKRIYFITKPTGDTGQHCHLKEQELFVVQAGSCTAVIDQGNGLEEIKLTAPSDAIYVGNYVWHGFKDLSEDLVLLALSSTNYNSNREDYIEDYDRYKQQISKQ